MIYRYLKDFYSLFFPNLCNACGESLVNSEKLICIRCLYQLPYTNYHFFTDNKLARQFWGKEKIENATAFLFFKHGGKVQRLMHQLKYNNVPELGLELGKQLGAELLKAERYKDVQAIIPVPLHPKKHKIRGYNQSEQIALGLSESMNIPVYNNILRRIKNDNSQTAMNRLARYENLKLSFAATKPAVELEHILLVDDTITTGATLEACAIALKQAEIPKISIAGIAFAD